MLLRIICLKHAGVKETADHQDLPQQVRLVDCPRSATEPVARLVLLLINLVPQLLVLLLNLLYSHLGLLNLSFGLFNFVVLFFNLRLESRDFGH